MKDLWFSGYEPSNVEALSLLLEKSKIIFKKNISDVPLIKRYDAAIAIGLVKDDRFKSFLENWVSFEESTFIMGAQASDKQLTTYDEFAMEWEGPVVKIKIHSFDLRIFPITVIEYRLFIESNGYLIKDFWNDEGWEWKIKNNISLPYNWYNQIYFQNCPVSCVSWYEAIAFCNWLSSYIGEGRYNFYLPSEVEWEYAARKNIPDGRRFPWGESISFGELSEANWAGCNLRRKTPVGMFPASNTADGLVDMYGNVEEWCMDSWSTSLDSLKTNIYPVTIANEINKVVRGGSTIRFMRLCRPTYRSRSNASQRYPTIGFRIARKIKN